MFSGAAAVAAASDGLAAACVPWLLRRAHRLLWPILSADSLAPTLPARQTAFPGCRGRGRHVGGKPVPPAHHA